MNDVEIEPTEKIFRTTHIFEYMPKSMFNQIERELKGYVIVEGIITLYNATETTFWLWKKKKIKVEEIRISIFPELKTVTKIMGNNKVTYQQNIKVRQIKETYIKKTKGHSSFETCILDVSVVPTNELDIECLHISKTLRRYPEEEVIEIEDTSEYCLELKNESTVLQKLDNFLQNIENELKNIKYSDRDMPPISVKNIKDALSRLENLPGPIGSPAYIGIVKGALGHIRTIDDVEKLGKYVRRGQYVELLYMALYIFLAENVKQLEEMQNEWDLLWQPGIYCLWKKRKLELQRE